MTRRLLITLAGLTLSGSLRAELPEWYLENRISFHAEFPYTSHQHPAFFGMSEKLSELGFRHIVHAIVKNDEGAWWQSEVGDSMPEIGGRSLGKQLIEQVHAQGMKLVVYYRHMEDAAALRENPDWQTVDHEGKPFQRRGTKLSLSSPYAEFLITRLRELAELGADGIYFDENHQDISWDPYTVAAFEKETGMDYPVAPDLDDPAYREAIQFNQRVVKRFFSKAKAAVKAVNPDCLMVISSHDWPALNREAALGAELLRVADSPKTEIQRGRDFHAPRRFKQLPSYGKEISTWMGYLLERDAADGSPAHVWLPGLVEEPAITSICAAVMASGNIANLGSPKALEIWKDATRIEPTLAMSRRASSHLAKASPYAWLRILVSDEARHSALATGDEEAFYEAFSAPLRGMFWAAHQLRLPVGFVTDTQLEEAVPVTCRLLFVMDVEKLNPSQREQVRIFRLNGGQVIENERHWDWSSAAGLKQAVERLEEIVERSRHRPPLRVIVPAEEDVFLAYYYDVERRGWLVSLVPSFYDFDLLPVWVEKTAEEERRIVASQQVERPTLREIRVLAELPDAAQWEVSDLLHDEPLEPKIWPKGMEIQLPEFKHWSLLSIYPRIDE